MKSPAPESGTNPAGRTFTFIDLAGFTAMTEAMSDDDAADVVARFCEIVREALGSEDRLVKSICDAVMLVSPAPAPGSATWRTSWTSTKSTLGHPSKGGRSILCAG